MKKIYILCFVLLVLNNVNAQWQQINSFYGGTIKCFAVDENRIFAGTSGGGLFITINNGSNWTEVNKILSNEYIKIVAVDGNNIGVVNSAGVFYLSNDNGNSWSLTNLNANNSVSALAIKGNYIFTATINGVYVSSNKGSSWTSIKQALNLPVFSFAILGDTIFTGTSNGVYLSTDSGSSWTAVNNGFPKNINLKVLKLAISGNNIFAITTNQIFLSSINNINWTNAINKGLPGDVTSIAINGNNIFAGVGGCGVWKRQLSEMLRVEEYNINTNVNLYSNPTSDKFTIEINNLKEPYTLEILNTMGHLTKQIITPAEQINLSSQAAGVYFVKL